MKLLVCGSREFVDTALLYSEIKKLHPKAIIQGKARGADQIAGLFATEFGLPNIEVPANWDYYHKAAGHIRNKWMLDFCQPDLVLAFPRGEARGTRGMMEISSKAGIEVREA